MHSSLFTQSFYLTPALAIAAVTTQISPGYPRLELQGDTRQAESPWSWSTTSQREPIFLQGAELASAQRGLKTSRTRATCSSSTSTRHRVPNPFQKWPQEISSGFSNQARRMNRAVAARQTHGDWRQQRSTTTGLTWWNRSMKSWAFRLFLENPRNFRVVIHLTYLALTISI